MTSHIRQVCGWFRETFWLVPAIMIALGLAGGLLLVELDRRGLVSRAFIESPWIYNGGATGARTLLGVVASSTIGVAGTAFSITIAALSLAAGQMGPRLLRNFTRDRGNQVTLGAFLATFVYALVVLRSVRTTDEGEFIPHLALSFGIFLAVTCVAMLVFFINHVAGRINVETVIDLVSGELGAALQRFATDDAGPQSPPEEFWNGAVPVADDRRGYLQHLDAEALASWAKEHGTAIRMLVRPGDFVFPGAPIAWLTREVDGADEAIGAATALASQRVSSDDLEYAVRQSVEVGVRAHRPASTTRIPQSGFSTGSVPLCAVSPACASRLGWFSGTANRFSSCLRSTTADCTDAMFHMIRQNGSASPAVLIRLIEVLTVVASCETSAARREVLKRHADLVLRDAERSIASPADLADVGRRHARFLSHCKENALRRSEPRFLFRRVGLSSSANSASGNAP